MAIVSFLKVCYISVFTMGNAKMKLIFLQAGLGCIVVATLWTSINGQCNICSALTNLACVSTTQFQICVEGIPTGAITSCPNGYVCSTIGDSICQLNQIGDCQDCNICDVSGTFACTGVQSYALCLGSSTPSEITGSCTPNLVCNIDYPQICVDTAEGFQPTCSTSLETTMSPTISPIENPQSYCFQLAEYGRFPVGNNASNTCRQYIFCFTTGGVWSGSLYSCPGRTYFNSTSRLCDDAVPENCF